MDSRSFASHASEPVLVPGILSLPRITTLLASVLVALCSGTNYAYSAFSPQLGARLRVNHTQLNFVGMAGNVGVIISGPVWGRITDSRGPRIPLASAFVLLFVGYSGIRSIYDKGLPTSESTLPVLSLYTLMVCNFMTGTAANAGLNGSVNPTAKTFPDRMRGTATGLVLSGFGLSAFFFSSIARLAFPGNISSLLLFLSLGTAFPMILGSWLVRPIPLPASETSVTPTTSVQRVPDSRTHLLYSELPEEADEVESQQESPVEHKECTGPVQDVWGLELFESLNFWLFFVILVLLLGTGVMYIYNVGSMAQALFKKGNSSYDEAEALRWQAVQVSCISIFNFSGRILIGVISDFTKSRYLHPRSYSLTITASIFLLSQVVASRIDDVAHLWKSSVLVGLAYGCIVGLLPTLTIEWFGLAHFSENAAYLGLSSIIGGNIFSLAFGRNLDAHDSPSLSPSVLSSSFAPQCLEGRSCYVDSIYMTIAACSVALGLSVWAGWRDRHRHRLAEL